eukprot:COSAG02_NODE_3398_length_6811_cov_26.210965_3_plen_144_part_00
MRLSYRGMADAATLAHVSIDFRVLVYRERYDDSNIMGELFLRPDCTFEQVRQIIAEVSAPPHTPGGAYAAALEVWSALLVALILSCHSHDELMCRVRTWVKTVQSNWFTAISVTRWADQATCWDLILIRALSRKCSLIMMRRC